MVNITFAVAIAGRKEAEEEDNKGEEDNEAKKDNEEKRNE